MTEIHDSYMKTRTLEDAALAEGELRRVAEFCKFATSVKNLPGTDVVLGYDAQDPTCNHKAIAILLDGSPIAICRLRKDLYEEMRPQKEAGQDVIRALEEYALNAIVVNDPFLVGHGDSMNYLVPQLLDRHFSDHSICVP
ncbi:hypothetical protein JMM33_004723, partial [Escherichia coli]|nr:hypothetical protein [Escherichia coli]